MTETNDLQVAIIGGGLAGLTAAAFLSQKGIRTCVIEKNEYPVHKVCGEYVSYEVLPLLHAIGFDPFSHGAIPISRFWLTDIRGRSIHASLDMGAFGISRYRFDHALMELAKQQGAEIIAPAQATQVSQSPEGFEIKLSGGKSLRAKVLIHAAGKHSNIDRMLERPFFQQNSPYIGVKSHFSIDFPMDTVALHNFPGGYCGVSGVEDGIVNVCFLSTVNDLKKAGSVKALEQGLCSRNPWLAKIFHEGKRLFEEPKAISQVSFHPKSPVESGIIMAGDAAGLITPLCGNGMAMAIHSGYLASAWVADYFHGTISRDQMLSGYGRAWKQVFLSRLRWGKQIQSLFGKPGVSSAALAVLRTMPPLVKFMMQKTHGKTVYPGI